MSAPVARTLLATLRFGSDRDLALPAAWARLDPGGVADWLAYEGASLWLWRRLRALDLVTHVDPALLGWIETAARRTSARNLLVQSQTDEVVRFFTSHGFPFVLLKSTALHASPGKPPYADARATTDVDVLLPEDQASAGWDALIRAGYRLQTIPTKTPPGHYHLPVIVNEAEVPVEVHHSISLRVPAADVWRRMSDGRRVVLRGGVPLVVPSVTELVWHAVAHAQEGEARAFRLRHFVDVAALWSSDDVIDWGEIHRRLDGPEVADKERTLAWLGVAAWLANRPFPAALPAPARPFDLERAVAWRIDVCRWTSGRPRIRDLLLEEGTRAETGMPLAPTIPGVSRFKRMRRRSAIVAARGAYRVWHAVKGMSGRFQLPWRIRQPED